MMTYIEEGSINFENQAINDDDDHNSCNTISNILSSDLILQAERAEWAMSVLWAAYLFFSRRIFVYVSTVRSSSSSNLAVGGGDDRCYTVAMIGY